MNFERNTFFLDAKTDPKDRVDVEIGDSKQDDFHPQVKIKRWDNEVNTSFRYVHDEKNPVVVEEDGKVKWKGKDTEAHFYELEDGYEFEVILKKKPASNVVQFTLNTKGLDFFYQPALTEQEIADGAFRPENVIGSYAVYASENKMNVVGGKEYKCGKVGHIYRPEIIDADGVKVWGELSIDTDAGILSVTVPQEFLDNAKYPVIVDPTFGYVVFGSSSNQLTSSSRSQASTVYSYTANGLTSLSSITVYGNCFALGTGEGNVTLGVYDLIAGTPTNRVITGNITFNSTTPSEKTVIVSSSLSSSTVYDVAMASAAGTTCSASGNTFYYDTVSSSYRTGTAATLDNPWSNFGTATTLWSIYATYFDPSETRPLHHFYLKQGWQ